MNLLKNEMDEMDEMNNLNDLNNLNDFNNLNEMLENITSLIDDQNDIFAGKLLLDKSEQENDKFKNVKIVIYQINRIGMLPFLQYIFYKTADDELQFIPCKSHLLSDCLLFIEEVCRSYRLGMDVSTFRGYFRKDADADAAVDTDTDDNDKKGDLYVFFELPPNTIDCHLLFSSNDLWLLTMDEVFNHFIRDFRISEDIKLFFKNNPLFGLLKSSDDGTFIDTPMILYHGCARKKAPFLATFGIPPSSQFARYQYVFYTLETVLSQTSPNGALIRFAVFLGNMTFIEDFVEDSAADYDSIFDQVNSVIRIENYEQIVPLSFHYLNYNNQII